MSTSIRSTNVEATFRETSDLISKKYVAEQYMNTPKLLEAE